MRHTSFKHGWFYHYRQHLEKTLTLCKDYPQLTAFLDKMHTDCPHDYFSDGPRSSKLRMKLPVEMAEVTGHPVSTLAEVSHGMQHHKTAHSRVQVQMLEFDAETIAAEVPIWLHPHEWEHFSAVFESEKPLSGHIDALSIIDNNIWIWDYKPKADKEKYAATQIYMYAYMLSKRTGIPLEHFRCGYFDEDRAYLFKPEPETINMMALQVTQ